MQLRRISAFAALALLSACSASLRGGSAVAQPEAGKPIDGLPYRVRDQLKVEVYRLTDKGYVLVGSQSELLADPSRLYVLNFEGRPLADATLKIDQRPDGSLSAVDLSSSGKAADLATNVSAGLDALQAAHKTETDARTAADTAAEAAKTKAAGVVAAQYTAQAAAVHTRDEVDRLQLKLDEDRATLKPSEVAAQEDAIKVAKIQANAAAVAAGEEIPFPDIK